MSDQILIVAGIVSFMYAIVFLEVFLHELGHFFAAKAFRVSVKEIVFISVQPKVIYQDPGEPIKDGFAYFLEAPRVHQNIILLAGPLSGLLAAPFAYLIMHTYPDNAIMSEILSGWLVLAVVGIPLFMFILNILPVKLGRFPSDGYHLFHGPTEP